MNLRVEKRVGVQATSDRIWSLISDLGSWSRWNPVETAASGTIAFGASLSLTQTIPGLPERAVVARVGDWQPLAQLVWTEKRGFLSSSLRYYEIQELEPGNCIVSNGFIFSGLRGETYFDKHKRALRLACEQVGEALKVASEAT